MLFRGSLALGQACCAGSGAYQPARLKLHEDLLLGVGLKFSDQLGYADELGKFHASARGSGEQDFSEDLLGTVRVLDRGQVGVDVPFVETNRYVPGSSAFGGGIGDVSLTARWDFLYADESQHLPGFALLGGVTFPTGATPESSSTLGVDTTGQGAWQAALGLAVERTFFNHLVANLTALVTQSFERNVKSANGMSTSEQLGTQFSGLAAVGWIFPNESAVAATFTYSDSLDGSLNGQTLPDSARQTNTLGISAGYPLDDLWRLQATAFWDLPVIGRNHNDGIGGSFTVVRALL